MGEPNSLLSYSSGLLTRSYGPVQFRGIVAHANIFGMYCDPALQIKDRMLLLGRLMILNKLFSTSSHRVLMCEAIYLLCYIERHLRATTNTCSAASRYRDLYERASRPACLKLRDAHPGLLGASSTVPAAAAHSLDALRGSRV